MRRVACLLLLVLLLGAPYAVAEGLSPASELSPGIWTIREDASGDTFIGGARGLCHQDAYTLCLHEQWFSVQFTLDWGTDEELPGHVILNPLRDGYGGFWVYSDDNPEMAIKVLDGCAVNGRFWVYASGLTDRAFLLSVRDGNGNVSNYVKFAGYMVSFQDTSPNFACPGY